MIKQEAYGRKADIWSLGMTVLEMATAKHPWQNFTNKFAAMTEIASGTSLPDIPAALSPQCRDLMARCIQHEMDHLNGVLFVDRVTDASGLEKELKENGFQSQHVRSVS